MQTLALDFSLFRTCTDLSITFFLCSYSCIDCLFFCVTSPKLTLNFFFIAGFFGGDFFFKEAPEVGAPNLEAARLRTPKLQNPLPPETLNPDFGVGPCFLVQPARKKDKGSTGAEEKKHKSSMSTSGWRRKKLCENVFSLGRGEGVQTYQAPSRHHIQSLPTSVIPESRTSLFLVVFLRENFHPASLIRVHRSRFTSREGHWASRKYLNDILNV